MAVPCALEGMRWILQIERLSLKILKNGFHRGTVMFRSSSVLLGTSMQLDTSPVVSYQHESSSGVYFAFGARASFHLSGGARVDPLTLSKFEIWTESRRTTLYVAVREPISVFLLVICIFHFPTPPRLAPTRHTPCPLPSDRQIKLRPRPNAHKLHHVERTQDQRRR